MPNKKASLHFIGGRPSHVRDYITTAPYAFYRAYSMIIIFLVAEYPFASSL